MRRFLRLPSPAMVIAVIALFVALDVTSVARHLLNGGRSIANSTIPGRLLVRDTLTGREVRESRLGTVPRAASADTAARASSAATADTATNAGTANNALNLGGVAASFFQQRCTDGAVKGYVRANVPTTGTFPVGYTSEATRVPQAFNCAGGGVEVRRVGVGDYRVRFINNPSTVAVASSFNDFDNFVAVGRVADPAGGLPPAEQVFRVQSRDDTGTLQDRSFTLLVP